VTYGIEAFERRVPPGTMVGLQYSPREVGD
jgi:hypothetical protein